MKLKKFARYALSAVLLLGNAFAPVQAANDYTIYYQTNDLTDLHPGEDLWQYQYMVSGPDFLTFDGFDIFFPVGDYLSGDLSSPTAPNSEWDVLTVQPDLPLLHDGFFEAYALQDAPSLNDWFLLDFIWRGSGTPGAQAFNIIDANLAVLESGTTTLYNTNPSIPEPATWLMLLPGLYYLKRRRH